MGERANAADIAFGQRLRQARVDAGLSAAAMAEALFVARESVDRYLRGERRPTEDVVARWEELCGVEPLALLSEYRQLPVRRAAGPQIAESEYVSWLVDRFSYMQTAGIAASQHVQLPLTDVFVTPDGVHVRVGGSRWGTRAQEQLSLLAERQRCGELGAEEYEAQLDRLGIQPSGDQTADVKRVSVLEVVRDAERAVVLGGPGTGKTTLLRYLVLRHADALVNGQSIVSPLIGSARLPVYVGAGDFARSPQRDRGLSAFVARFLTESLECPLDADCLQQLITRALRAGRCLVLVDGLDEVSSAAERTGVVEHITSFVAAHLPRGNRFVCTSRVSGYAAAPLPTAFTALRLLEMNDASIERFLRAYVPAIEHSEAPDKTPAIVARDAERIVSELLDAVAHSPGVRHLAGNPLLLMALLLVHRTRGRLPERRVDAYRAVVDALGHTWRAHQGIPTSELPDERRLRTWLTRLAEWMHDERPEGSVTVRDLLRVLGPLWATLHRQAWDDTLLGEADPASTQAGAEIVDFVCQVEQHSGLLVERAPRRWGFPHLTFEEFYVARSLAFGRVADRPAQIRRRLHDPRYDEPILLALGLVAADYTEDSEDLFESALLARGEDAERLGLQPTALEDLLGRDFRFALRALADDIPASPQLVDTLLNCALDEAVHAAGRGRFDRYREALLQSIEALKFSAAGARISELLALRVHDKVLADLDSRARILDVAERCRPHPAITVRLRQLLEAAEDARDTVRIAHVLARLGELPATVIERLIELPATSHHAIGDEVVQVIVAQGELSGATVERLNALLATRRDHAADRVAHVLAGQKLADDVAERLVQLLASTDDASTVRRVAQVLAGQSQLPATVIERLRALLSTTQDTFAATRVAQLLTHHGSRLVTMSKLSGATVDRLSDLVLTTADAVAASELAHALADHAEPPTRVVEGLGELLGTTENPHQADDDRVAGYVAWRAADVLARQRELPAEVVQRLAAQLATGGRAAGMVATALLRHSELPAGVHRSLIELLESTQDAFVAQLVARCLATHGQLPAQAVEHLIELLQNSNDPGDASRLAGALADHGDLPARAVERLRVLLQSTDRASKASPGANVLANQGKLTATLVDHLATLIARTDDARAASDVAQALARQGELPARAVERLAELLESTDSEYASMGVAEVLAGQSELPGTIVSRLGHLVASGHLEIDADRARLAGRMAHILAGQRALPARLVRRLSFAAKLGRQAPYEALWPGAPQSHAR